jgi:DNA-binding NtrC family response regulator
MRVLVISRDRHFRSVASTLLAHRGCSVTTTAKVSRVAEMITHDHADVVVVDAGQSPAAAQAVAAVGALAQPVGIVVVDEASSGAKRPPILAKWGPFEELFAAIERADEARVSGNRNRELG